MLLCIQSAHADDFQPTPADLAHQALIEQRFADLEKIAATRDVVIEELVDMWFMNEPGWEEEFRSALGLANDRKLLAIRGAERYAEVQSILSGGTPDDFIDTNSGTALVLGDIDKDFVYTPVRPCRIVDTRLAGGKIPSNTFRSFYVHGSGALIDTQGGNPDGCTAPRGEPRAVHMNIVAVGSTARGFLTVWPKGTAHPLSGVLNFSPTDKTDPISNAFTVKTGFLVGEDITVYASSATHVVADVMGYYYQVDEDDFKVRFSGWGSTSRTVLTVAGGCTNQTGGRVIINVPGPGKVMVTAQAMMGLKSHTMGTLDMFMLHIGVSPTDCTLRNTLEGYNQMGISIPANEASWSATAARLIPVTVSRTFTVNNAGTKTYYLNGRRLGGHGAFSFWETAIQAVYYPDM